MVVLLGVGINNICNDQCFSFQKSMLHHLEKTFWLTAGISSISQHIDNIALNTGMRHGHGMKACKHQELIVQSELLQTALTEANGSDWTLKDSHWLNELGFTVETGHTIGLKKLRWGNPCFSVNSWM